MKILRDRENAKLGLKKDGKKNSSKDSDVVMQEAEVRAITIFM